MIGTNAHQVGNVMTNYTLQKLFEVELGNNNQRQLGIHIRSNGVIDEETETLTVEYNIKCS